MRGRVQNLGDSYLDNNKIIYNKKMYVRTLKFRESFKELGYEWSVRIGPHSTVNNVSKMETIDDEELIKELEKIRALKEL